MRNIGFSTVVRQHDYRFRCYSNSSIYQKPARWKSQIAGTATDHSVTSHTTCEVSHVIGLAARRLLNLFSFRPNQCTNENPGRSVSPPKRVITFHPVISCFQRAPRTEKKQGQRRISRRDSDTKKLEKRCNSQRSFPPWPQFESIAVADLIAMPATKSAKRHLSRRRNIPLLIPEIDLFKSLLPSLPESTFSLLGELTNFPRSPLMGSQKRQPGPQTKWRSKKQPCSEEQKKTAG